MHVPPPLHLFASTAATTYGHACSLTLHIHVPPLPPHVQLHQLFWGCYFFPVCRTKGLKPCCCFVTRHKMFTRHWAAAVWRPGHRFQLRASVEDAGNSVELCVVVASWWSRTQSNSKARIGRSSSQLNVLFFFSGLLKSFSRRLICLMTKRPANHWRGANYFRKKLFGGVGSRILVV